MLIGGRTGLLTHTVRLRQGNQSSIRFTSNPSKYRRSKHILTKISYLNDMKASKIIVMQYLPTESIVDCTGNNN